MLGLSRFGYHVLNIKCQIKRGGTHVIWPYLLLRHQRRKKRKKIQGHLKIHVSCHS